MVARNYTNVAVSTTLTSAGGISAGATAMVTASQNGWPIAFPFTARLDPGLPTEELVTVNSGAGTVGSPYQITRGQDGTAAAAHSIGAVVVHSVSARDLREPQVHIDTITPGGVHGLPASAWNVTELVYKTTDQGYSSDITMNADLQLKVNVVATGIYKVRLLLLYTAGGGDIATQWDVPVGTTGPNGTISLRSVIGPATDVSSKTSSPCNVGCWGFANNAAYGGVGTTQGTHHMAAREEAILVAGATGLITVQHCQLQTHADATTVRAGSYIESTRIG